ncbi:MAG: OmpA family protein [Planctomycetaceae bacterium]|jgi:chemotaxis protein MotB|nr:OmpA family protein [Planctomycetaceae bacterium]
MARAKPPEAGVPEWVLTFGDMMSLLLCFFIMLFSMSIIAEIKWEAIVETLQRELGYAGTSRTKTHSKKTTTTVSTTAERSRRTAALTGGQPVPGPQGEFPLVQTIRVEGVPVKGGLIRFDPGSDELTEQAMRDLKVLLVQLTGGSNKIMVKGHSAPTETGGQNVYKEDYDLAYNRAVRVMKYLISLGLKKEFFEITAVDSSAVLNRAILPPGTDPKLAGACVEVYLLDKTLRVLNDNTSERRAADAPVPGN